MATQEGFDVSSAGSLKEAREQLASGPADLVVIDLMLPDGDGISLLRELKASSSSDVILVSGMATVDSAIEALRLGALDYLTKPLDNRRLKAVLAHVLRLRSLNEEVGTLRSELRKFGRFETLLGWVHSGFAVHGERVVWRDDLASLERLARYALRAPCPSMSSNCMARRSA